MDLICSSELLISALRTCYEGKMFLVGFVSNLDGHVHFPRDYVKKASNRNETMLQSANLLSRTLYHAIPLKYLLSLPFETFSFDGYEMSCFDIDLNVLESIAQSMPSNAVRTRLLGTAEHSDMYEFALPIPIDESMFFECPAAIDVSSDIVENVLFIPSSKLKLPWISWGSDKFPLMSGLTRLVGSTFLLREAVANKR